MDDLRTVQHRRRRIDSARLLRDVLRYEIYASGGDFHLLPDERELIARLGCSRNELRQALSLLRDDHLIERRQGLGTMVLGDSTTVLETSLYRGLVHNLADGPRRVRYQLLAAHEVPSFGSVGSLLGIPDGEPAYVISRLAVVDGMPTILWDTYVRTDVGVALAAADEARDIYDLFDGLGVAIVDVRMQVEAVLADLSVSAVLDVDAGLPLLRFERVLSDRDGAIVALSFGRARGDRMVVSVRNRRPDPGAAGAS